MQFPPPIFHMNKVVFHICIFRLLVHSIALREAETISEITPWKANMPQWLMMWSAINWHDCNNTKKVQQKQFNPKTHTTITNIEHPRI